MKMVSLPDWSCAKLHNNPISEEACVSDGYKPASQVSDLQEVIALAGQSEQNSVCFLHADCRSSVVVSSLMDPDALLMDGWLGTQLHRDYWSGRHWDTATLLERLN